MKMLTDTNCKYMYSKPTFVHTYYFKILKQLSFMNILAVSEHLHFVLPCAHSLGRSSSQSASPVYGIQTHRMSTM